MRRMDAIKLLACSLACGLAALASGCATPPPSSGAARAEVIKAWGVPTAVYALTPAGERLEYASGPYGRTTWMIDIDAAGRVLQARQVLGDSELMLFQQHAGLTRDEVLRRIGSPGERRTARRGGEVWSWRYPTNDCLWFQVSVARDGSTDSGAFAIDPECDARDPRSD